MHYPIQAQYIVLKHKYIAYYILKRGKKATILFVT